MRFRTKALPILLVAVLLPWLGVLQAIPHHHVDSAVPQEELACTASSPTSQETHLHPAGHLVAPHPCLACLIGPQVFGVPEHVATGIEDRSGWVGRVDLSETCVTFPTRLPLSRGPPTLV